MTQIAPEIVHYAVTTILDSIDQDPGRLQEDCEAEKAAATMMYQECVPQNATESVLAMRAVIAHHTSTACFRRAMLPEMPMVLQTRLIAQGIALSRLSSAPVKALRAEPGRIDPMQSGAPARPAAPAKASVQFNPMQSGDKLAPQPAPVAAERPVTDPKPAMRAIMAATGRGGRKYAGR